MNFCLPIQNHQLILNSWNYIDYQLFQKISPTTYKSKKKRKNIH